MSDQAGFFHQMINALKTSRFYAAYRRFFSVAEIEQDISLQWLQGAVLFGFFSTYLGWFYRAGVTVQSVANSSYTCWPFWQSCASAHVLSALPNGYSQPIVYMVLFGFMMLVPYLMYRKEWTLAHFLMLLLVISKSYFMLVDYELKANYDYYHWLFAFVLVVLPHKKFFTQLTLVMAYFLSTSSKMSPAWILGSYFTTLRTGLPVFPQGTEAFFTNLVIVAEMFSAWFLFSRRRIIQRLELTFYTVFHLYSGILVGYFYPSIVLPVLLIVFGPWFAPYKQVPLDRKSIGGWCLMAMLVLLQVTPVLIKGNERLTNEGNFYGFYMFEANHQCAADFSDAQGKVVMHRDSVNARNRCDVYQEWFRAKNKLCRTGGGPIALVFDHSVNGGPFYRIVDQPDICTLTYKPFSHNEWIKDETSAPVVGYPRQNIYQ